MPTSVNIIDLYKSAKETRDFDRIAEAIPYASFLGLTLQEKDGKLMSTLNYSEILIGNPVLPALHGGTIGALLENAAIAELLWEIECHEIPRTIDFTTEYLRRGRPEDAFATAIITKHGRRVANVRATAWQGNPSKPIATGHGHFLLS